MKPNLLKNFQLHVTRGNYAYPYNWDSMQSPAFFSILKALHEPSEWILRDFNLRILVHGSDRVTGNTVLRFYNNDSLIAEAIFAISDLFGSTQPAYVHLTATDIGIDTKNNDRLLQTVAIAATIVSMEKELGYDRSLDSKQTFSYGFDIHQIPVADAFFQKMSGACSRFKSINSEVTQSDPETNPNHYCTFTWSGSLVQVEEIARQSVDFGIELGFVNSAEELFKHFSITPYLPHF